MQFFLSSYFSIETDLSVDSRSADRTKVEWKRRMKDWNNNLLKRCPRCDFMLFLAANWFLRINPDESIHVGLLEDIFCLAIYEIYIYRGIYFTRAFTVFKSTEGMLKGLKFKSSPLLTKNA